MEEQRPNHRAIQLVVRIHSFFSLPDNAPKYWQHRKTLPTKVVGERILGKPSFLCNLANFQYQQSILDSVAAERELGPPLSTCTDVVMHMWLLTTSGLMLPSASGSLMLPLPRLVRAPLRRHVPAPPRAAFSNTSKPSIPHGSDADGSSNAAASHAIVRLVAAGGGGLEADLDRLFPFPAASFSHGLVSSALRALTDHGLPAERFFAWASSPGARAHNLLVENAGRLGDYGAMSRALALMSERRIPLTHHAFAFLGSSRSGSSVEDSARAVLGALEGPCRASGVFSLVKALASVGEFGAAVSVIEETAARKVQYYNVLIAAKCRAGDFVGARKVFDEMRRSGPDPDANTWNYLLGCMLKNGRLAEACGLVEAMERLKRSEIPNSLTYEILTYHACKAGKMDSTMRILDQMFSENLAPRITTHSAFIKGYFYAGRVEDACKYVSDMSTRDRHSVNRNYSLLAKLLRSSGKTIEAGRVLYELMEKGLRPDHCAYVKVAKDLHKMGRGDLASELKLMFQRFGVQTDMGR